MISIIKNTPSRFRLAPDDILALRQEGVSDPVIQAMVEGRQARKAEAPEPPSYPVGVHALVDDELTTLTPINAEIKGGFLSGLKASFTGRIKRRREVNGKTSDTHLETTSPELFVYLPGRDVTRLTIVQCKVKDNSREVGAMKSSFWSMGTKTEADEIPISLDEVQPSVFKVVLPGRLEPGEYAVVDLSTIASPGLAEVWDFTLTGQEQISGAELSR